MTWTKIARSDDGSVITYAADGTDERLLVQSVKHTVEHANRGGTWEYTSFFVICDGVELIEKWRLKEAKEYAEKAWEERHD